MPDTINPAPTKGNVQYDASAAIVLPGPRK